MPARRRVPAAAGLVAAGAAAVVLVAGCTNGESEVQKHPHSGSGSASAVGGVQQVTITSGTDLRFHPSTITVHPGKVRVILKNTAKPGNGPPHNIESVDLPGLSVPLTPAGVTAETTFVAPAPGRYQFVCTIHENQGQYGTLVVTRG